MLDKKLLENKQSLSNTFRFSRSSRLQIFNKIDVPKNFAKFTGIHLCQGFHSNKVASFLATTLLKKRP